MIHLVQRLIHNAYGWIKPSPGRLGSSGEGEYVRENGFGHEDWNFNLDLSIDDHIYGYFYYSPRQETRNQPFAIAFVIRQEHRWLLVGFYMKAWYVPAGVPREKRMLETKKAHLLELRAANSLGKRWSSDKIIAKKLEDEGQYINWKVNVTEAIRLPQPIPIPDRIYDSKNYHLTRPSEVSQQTFEKLRQLASQLVLPMDDDEASFPEGREIYLKHRARERSATIVELAKSNFIERNGRLFCEVCGFDFERTYGDVGRGFIEAHHTIPLSELKGGSQTKLKDLALVCSNCHRMLHRKRPWKTVVDIKLLLEPTLG